LHGLPVLVSGWCSALFFLICASSLSGAVVFSALEEARWVLYYQAELNRKAERVWSADGVDQMSARLSADTRKIAFESGNDLTVVERSESAKPFALDCTLKSAARPAWHPGTMGWFYARFTSSAAGEDSDLWLKDGRQQEPYCVVRHTGNQDYPSISSNGTQLAYTSAQVVSLRQGAVEVFQQLWVLDLVNGRARQIFLEASENIEPAWSPSGEEIAFASNKSGQFEIWSVRPDGTGLRQITTGPGSQNRPTWSPDGKQILFTLFQEGRYGLALVDAKGGEIKPYRPFGAASKVEIRDADWK
jgi:Tol biopolymer transport system component